MCQKNKVKNRKCVKNKKGEGKMFCYNKGTKLKIHRNQKGKGKEEA